MKRAAWSAQEIATLRDLYPNSHTAIVSAAVGRGAGACHQMAAKLGIKKTRETIAAMSRLTAENPALIAARIQPGATPWNKGLKGVNGTSATSFKPGNKPQTWQPVGTQSVNKEGHAIRKVSDTGDRLVDWQRVDALIWIEAHGPIPDGFMVVVKDKAQPVTLDNLELLNRSGLMKRNTYHRYPPEVARLYQLKGAINRQVNRLAKETA